MSVAAHWRQTATVRLRDAPGRFFFSIMIALSGELATESALWPLAWLVAVNLAQLLTLAILEPARRNPDFVVSRRRELAFLASLALSAITFAASGALLWLDGGWDARVMGVIVLAGGAVNVALQAGHSAKLLWTACVPFMLVLMGLPLMTMLSAPQSERGMLGVVTLACGLFVLHLGASGARSLDSYRKLQLALEEAQAERRRAEAASAAKSDFLGVMSHELRTPLNGILGMTQALERDGATAAQREGLEVIRHSGESLLMLINDLLDLSKIETSRLQLDRDVIDVAGLATHAESLFRPLAKAKGLKLQVRRVTSAALWRTGDPVRVRQILHNLLGVAVRNTDAGTVSVVIHGSCDELVFEVCDQGHASGDNELDRVFDRFRSDDLPVSQREEGLGLSLGIARGLARMMGGEVTISTNSEIGSTFSARMALPAVRKPRRSKLKNISLDRMPACPQDADAAQIRILAAEDNPTNQLVLKTLLDQVGLDVHVVGDGQEAVEAWRSGPWDLVLMDIRMPVMDGLAATQAIRAAEAAEGRTRTPIVAVTAEATSRQAADYMAVGMDGLAPKPIQLPQLLAVISEAIAGATPAAGVGSSLARPAA